jgi:hypothetical protein
MHKNLCDKINGQFLDVFKVTTQRCGLGWSRIQLVPVRTYLVFVCAIRRRGASTLVDRGGESIVRLDKEGAAG